jgi:hypothetical protein
MPVFTLRSRTGDAAICRDQAASLLLEVTRCLYRGVRHENLIIQAALIWRNASHLEPAPLN